MSQATRPRVELTDKRRKWCEDLKASVKGEAASFEERTLLAAESFRQSEGQPSRVLRVAQANCHIFSSMPIRIREGEILVGWHPNTRIDPPMQERLREAHEYLKTQDYWANASEGHMAPDYPTLLSSGLGGVKDKIRELIGSLGTSEEATRKLEFYHAAETSLEALQKLILRYADLAETMMAEARDPDWGLELERIAEALRQISSGPPRTFREAIQLVWFVFLGVAIEAGTAHRCLGPGHIDRYLLPFYRREEDRDEADALLEQLFIKCNEFHGPAMSAVIVGIGGRNPDGSDATNELSYRCLEASRRAAMYFPGVDVLWHRDMDEEFMRQACRLLRNGMGQPSFFNSDLIVKGLMRYGVPFEHAVDHLPSTCTETSIQGRSNPWVAWPYVNVPLSLLYALFNGRHPLTGRKEGLGAGLPRSYEELLRSFFKELEFAAHRAIERGIRDQLEESKRRPFPLLSCFIRNCLEEGRDISHGGALYNFLQPEAVGVSNVVDGLAAIKVLVRDQQRFTLDDFREAIRKDFEGYEGLRRAILEDCPKHGNNVPWVNDLFSQVAGGWCSAIEGHKNFYGGPVLPGFLGWTVWIDFGRNTPATPDGRRAGKPLSNSTGPCTGVRAKGAPSVFLSCRGFDQSRGLGGIVFNLRFSSSAITSDAGVERLKNLIETAFDLGTYQVQINLASSQVLRDAQRNPDNYADLLVRIGGYLVPFTLLPAEAQEDVIARTEMEI